MFYGYIGWVLQPKNEFRCPLALWGKTSEPTHNDRGFPSNSGTIAQEGAPER